MGNAFPVLFQKKDLEKRLVITRVHTAPTNTVTDFYSTTTNVVVAPTVEFIISNGVTLTTTLIPAGVDPTALPAATLTTVIQDKHVNNPVTTTTADDPSNSAVVTENSPVNSPTTTSTPAPANPQAGNVAQTTSASPNNVPETTQATTEAATTEATKADTTTLVGNQNQNAPTTLAAVGNAAVAASAVSQPPAQAHTDSTTATTIAMTTPTTEAVATTSSSTSTSAIATASSTPVSSGNTAVPKAFTYSPYNSDGTCRSASDVYNDLQIIKSKGVSQVRIYGTDCNSIETVQPACAKLGIKINQGFWIGSSGTASIDGSVADLISYGQQSGWDVFEFITIGNEAIISGFCTPSDLISKIQSVKNQLRAAGYNGQVTTSEPPVSFQNNPELCTSSAIDFVGINPHSYFNSDIDASEAGSFVKGQLQLVQKICGTSNVFITETGYPSSGIANGKNVPSTENQQIAIKSILDELDQDVTILSYFNDLWKNPGPYGIEQSFGIQSIMG